MATLRKIINSSDKLFEILGNSKIKNSLISNLIVYSYDSDTVKTIFNETGRIDHIIPLLIEYGRYEILEYLIYECGWKLRLNDKLLMKSLEKMSLHCNRKNIISYYNTINILVDNEWIDETFYNRTDQNILIKISSNIYLLKAFLENICTDDIVIDDTYLLIPYKKSLKNKLIELSKYNKDIVNLLV